MTRQRRRFILKLVRLQNALDALEQRAAEQYDRDSAFDGGEFCGPAIGRETCRETLRICARFGFTHPEWAETCWRMLRCERIVNAHDLFGGPMPLPR